jgi:DNA-binding transcriptional LysR family regulator
MDNRITEMQVFVQVVESGSLSEASRRLLLSASTVSKMMGRIEARLGVGLIERSTRRLSLTAEGQLYYERSRHLLDEFRDVEHDVARGARQARGTVRISVPVAFGVIAMEPLLPEFWENYPNIAVDISISDEVIDLYRDRTDIAFRIGALPNSSMIAQRIGSIRRKIVASPGYLERRGTPRTIAELADHNCLDFNFHRSADPWALGGAPAHGEGAPRGSLQTNNGETIRRMAVAGVGVARLGCFQVQDDLDAGRLVEVLADEAVQDALEVHALYLSRSHTPQRVRAFLDFAVPRLRARLAA